jgi:hypothetical protein
VAFFVGRDGGGLQMDDLRDAADWCHFWLVRWAVSVEVR